MRPLAVSLAAGLLLLAGLSIAPTATASCMQVGHAGVVLTCVVCPLTNATEVARTAERGANAIVVCVVDGFPP
ncbi:MAG: hypothetical protein ABR586_09085, partial [Thermoplasmatota archaeon]